MEGKKLLHSIRLKNLLSYGSEGVNLELEPLNVLIGPNASGKSNLIEAISLLAAAPRNFLAPFREGGFAEDWLWKGGGDSTADIQAVLAYPREDVRDLSLFYQLQFRVTEIRIQIIKEWLNSPEGPLLRRTPKEFIIYQESAPGNFDAVNLRETEKMDPQQSMLSQLRDPIDFPYLTYVSDQLAQIKLFRGWPFGRNNILRKAQDVHLPDDFLLEDGSNLGLILNDLQNRRETKRLILENLRLLYESVEDVTTKVQGGAIQIFFHEEGLATPIPAFRLSDGTLHFLCLLTVLLHPDPPPLICIEEPELGLHPDIMRTIAKLLIEASQRTQLIVTTHSETLISALSEVPESVVVCERDAGGTDLKRLEPEQLRGWIDRHLLGELWAMGEIGGNRW